jgi:hypothetical protein
MAGCGEKGGQDTISPGFIMAAPKIPERVLPDVPASRPLERFWPYTDIAEQPSDAELAKVEPDLREAVFGPLNLPFSVSLVFPDFPGDAGARAVRLAQASDDYYTHEADGRRWHRARFHTGDRPMRLRDLYLIVAGVPGNEILINDKRVPYARELWLPLVWLLIR